MCNYLGMDTVSLGATLAWAMECFEHGLLTLEDTGGMPLRFHDADGVVKLVEMIAYRQGVGDLLAEGSLRAAQRLGRGSEAYLTTVKGHGDGDARPASHAGDARARISSRRPAAITCARPATATAPGTRSASATSSPTTTSSRSTS